MSISNKNNITKYSDVNRKLTKLEVDTNFQEVKNSIDDIDALELGLALKANLTQLQASETQLNNQIATKVDQVVYDNKISELESAIDGSTANRTIVRPTNSVGSVLRKDGESSLSLKAGTRVLVDGKYILFSIDTPVSLPVLVQGSDYSVWVSPNLTIEALEDNFESSAISPNPGAVKIGGFHCGLVSSGTTLASGLFATSGPGMIWTQTDVDKLILINQFTIWDLTYRPKCDPRGMFSVVTDTNEVLFWCDIYFCSTEHITLGTSRFNSNVASGTVLPKIPYMFGGDGTTTYSRFSYYEASEVVAAYNKRLMNYHEFSYAAYGVTENQSLGGATVTIPNTLRQPGYTSKWGGEQMTGHIWSLGGPFSSVGSTVYQADPGRGSFYGTTGLPLFGGTRNDSSSSGSRASNWSAVPWHSFWYIGVRAACDHLHL